MTHVQKLSEATKLWMNSGRRTAVNAHKVFVYERGDGPNVLMIHGFPTSCYDWRESIDLLKDSFRCIAFDFLGFGLSDKPEAYSYSLFQQTDMIELYIPGLKSLMKKPDAISDIDADVMKEILTYQNGNLRIPNVYAYVRERYLHKERWLGSLRSTQIPVQFIWATGDPVANHDMGKALAAMVPQARYTEV